MYTESTGGMITVTAMSVPAEEKGFDGANFTFELSVDDVCVEGDDGLMGAWSRVSRPRRISNSWPREKQGTFRDPFERVDFWMEDVNGQHWLLGSDDSGASGRNSDNDRTWTYSLDNVSGAMLYMMTRAAAGFADADSDMYTVRAFAVNGDNVALMASDPVMIDPN